MDRAGSVQLGRDREDAGDPLHNFEPRNIRDAPAGGKEDSLIIKDVSIRQNRVSLDHPHAPAPIDCPIAIAGNPAVHDAILPTDLFMSFRTLPALLAVAVTAIVATAESPRDGRVVFLGDSVTHAGGFIARLDLQLRRSDADCEVLNVGLPSETVTGLSEPAHPFPRPNVLDRLDSALKVTRPDWVVACYGVNDAIYHPFDEERFAKFQSGMERLAERVRQSGARLILMTPPPMDVQAARQKGFLATRGDGDTPPTDGYSWKAIDPDYNQTLARYAAWVRDHADAMGAVQVIDLYTPLYESFRDEGADDSDTAPSGATGEAMTSDGIHPTDAGHAVIADIVLEQWNLPSVAWPAPAMDLATRRMAIMRDSLLSQIGHKRPGMPPGMAPQRAQAEADSLDGQIDAMIQSDRSVIPSR